MTSPSLRVSAFRIDTRAPEADGTLAWDHTVLVTVEIAIGGVVGFGFTYADAATARFICEHLADSALGAAVMAPTAAFAKMSVDVRNVGRQGVAATGIAAVDMALWDAKAKRLGCSLVNLLGAVRPEVDAYASGGFTSSSIGELAAEMRRYAEQGFTRVKIKIADDGAALSRVRAARVGLGDAPALFVDANGAFTPKHALALATRLTDDGVRWFEEPCSSDDVDGLRFVRERAPVAMDIAAGEYIYEARAFERLLTAEAVDVLQADATRCGVTGFMQVATACAARGVPLSAHCAPTIHAQLGCAAAATLHVEHFFDHVRIEGMFFDGAIEARGGRLQPATDRPGIGVALKRADVTRHCVFDEERKAAAP